MLLDGKYGRIEPERRFLIDHVPRGQPIARVRRITDRYMDGTDLRLREQKEEDGASVFKLTQKTCAPAGGAQQGFITTMYLNQETYERLMQLPGKMLAKVRYSVPPFGIDVFADALEGVVMRAQGSPES